MFKTISVLLIISQCCSPSVFGSPVKAANDPLYLEEEMERLKPFVEELVKSLNTSVEPCDDYISYVTGHVKDTIGMGNNLNFLKSMLVDYMQENNHLTPSERKAKAFLDMCRNNLLKDDFFDTVKDLNAAQIEHFPSSVADWSTDKFVLSKSLGAFNRIGQRIVFDFRVEMEDEKRVFYLKPMASRDSFLEAEPEDFAKVFEYFGYTDDEVLTIKKDYRDLQQLIKGIDDTSEEFQVVTVGWMKENIPDFDWTQYFDIVGCGIIKETDEIHLQKDNIKNIIELLSKTDKKKVTNYVFYNFYRHLHSGQQYMIRNGKEECYEATYWFFPDVYINIALKEYLDDHDKINYINVSDSIRQALKDEITDKFVISRHDEFMKIITDPSAFENKVENSYKNIEVTGDNLYTNMLRVAYEISKFRVIDPYVLDFNKYVMTNLHLYHKQPRLFLSHYFSKELNYIIPAFEHEGQKCMDMVDQQKKFKSALRSLEYLKASNEEVFEHEKQFLEKYELNQNKVLLKLLTQCYISFDSDYTTTRKSELQNLVFSLDEFFTEYKCPNEKLFKLDEKVIGKDYCVI